MKTRLRILLFLLFVTSAPMILAHGDETLDTTDYELVDELEEVTEVGEQPSAVTVLVARLHPAVVHFPIAWMVLLMIVEGVGVAFHKETWHRAGLYLLWMLALSLLPAVISGLVNADLGNPSGSTLDLIQDHRNLNLAASILIVAALILRGRQRSIHRAIRRGVYLTLLVAATIAMMIAGHLGGELVHGSFFPL